MEHQLGASPILLSSPECPVPLTLPTLVSPSTLAPVGWASCVGKEVSGSKATSCPAASSQEGACLCCVSHNDNGGQLTSAPRVRGQQQTPKAGQPGAGWCWLSIVVSMGARRSGPGPDDDLAFSLDSCFLVIPAWGEGCAVTNEEPQAPPEGDSGLAFQRGTLQHS